MDNKYIALAPLFVLALSLSGCMGDGSNQTAPTGGAHLEGGIMVEASLYPLYEFAREVGGDRAVVHLLLAPGTEAHTFEPKPSDIVRVSHSDIFVYIGAGMEPWLKDILAGIDNKGLTIVDSSEYVKLLPASSGDPYEKEGDAHGTYDPHIWTDLENDQRIVDAIALAFIGKDPGNKDLYLENARRYNAKLQAMDKELSEGLKDCKRREYVNGGHMAFEYFNKRYNLTELAVWGISPDSEPSPRRIKEIADHAREHGIRYVYVERLVNPKVAQAIASEMGGRTLTLNAGHNLMQDQYNNGVSFISLMQENLNNLRTGLECS